LLSAGDKSLEYELPGDLVLADESADVWRRNFQRFGVASGNRAHERVPTAQDVHVAGEFARPMHGDCPRLLTGRVDNLHLARPDHEESHRNETSPKQILAIREPARRGKPGEHGDLAIAERGKCYVVVCHGGDVRALEISFEE